MKKYNELLSEIDILLKKHHEETAFLSDTDLVIDNKNFQKIVKIGNKCIPLLIKKLKEKDSLYIIYLIGTILDKDSPNVKLNSNYKEKYNVIMEWWEINKTNYERKF